MPTVLNKLDHICGSLTGRTDIAFFQDRDPGNERVLTAVAGKDAILRLILDVLSSVAVEGSAAERAAKESKE